MQKRERLILTGWGYNDYATAAAMLLRKFPSAKIRGISQRNLADDLQNLNLSEISEIFILGIGLTFNLEKLEDALEKITKNKISVLYFSSLSIDENLQKKLKKVMTFFIRERNYISTTVSEFTHEKIPNLLWNICTENSENNNENKNTAGKYITLIQASRYAYSNYQNYAFFQETITLLSQEKIEKDWSQDLKEFVEHFKYYGNREIIGKSNVIKKLKEKIDLLAKNADSRVLIFGESGTGKETVAQQIHNKSTRKKEPFIAFNCATANLALLESYFLGHEKGTFTGANELKLGLFERANGGTLFLDEISEMPIEAQGILLRVLEEGRFFRMGGDKEISVNVRLITATNKNLKTMANQKTFRQDLLYRLNVLQIKIPALNEHKEDIEDIARNFLLKRKKKSLNEKQIEDLMQYDFPGNVRELLNILERSIALNDSDFFNLINDDFFANTKPKKNDDNPTEVFLIKNTENSEENLEKICKLHVTKIVEKCHNNISHAAKKLGITRNSVRKYLTI